MNLSHRSLLFLAVALVAAGLSIDCSRRESPPEAVPFDTAGRIAPSGVPVMSQLPPFALTNESGEPFGTSALRGKVWVANFIFTRCESICPMMTAQMKNLQTELSEDPAWEDLRLVSFSLDPEYDTPEVLAEYAADNGADESHWRFLTGTRAAIWDLSRRGFKLPVDDNPGDAAMPIVHSQQFVLVDRAGRIRGYYDSLDSEHRAALVEDLAKVAAEPPPVAIPAEVADPPWLEARRVEQLAAAESYDVFHDFRFTDRRLESGITFIHQFVGDLGRNFKETHYDHGNGVAVADVDGDGLLDLYFTTQLGGNELWRNIGDGLFENITERAGVALDKRISVAPVFGDIDNDGDADLFVTTVRGGNVLFENDGTGTFTDISSRARVDHVGHSSGAIFFDYDRDGLLDLFVTNVGRYTTDEWAPEGYYVSYLLSFDGHLKPERYEKSILYRNLGGNRFEDVTETTGLVEDGWNGDPHPADFDEDGYPDMYLINMQGHDSYFANVGGERFERQPDEMFPANPFGSMGISIFDFNNDGRQDVYIVDMHTDMFSGVMFQQFIEGMEKAKLHPSEMPPLRRLKTDGNHVLGNAFYRNDGDGRFTEISDEIGAENYWPWGLSHGDLNADGYQDVFIASSMNFPFRYGINSVLLNEHGERFVDSEFVVGVEPRRNRRTAVPWFELDCLREDKTHSACQDRSGRIQVWAAIGSRSSVLFDLDDDGDIDIVTLDFGSEPMVLISDLTENRDVRFVKVALTGTESNRSGVGARVTVWAGGQTYTRVNDGKTGYLAQSDLPLYFGLDTADTVDSIEVVWPSGRTQVLEGPIEVNRLIEITER